MSENYVKKYDVGNIKIDTPRKGCIYDLPLLAFGDVQHSVGLSLVFNSRFASENPFYISSGFKFNIFKRLILNSNGDKPIEFEDEYGKRFALIDCVDKFTFDDESQRVVRKTGDRKFEIHYPDLSIEEYDGYGRIYRVRDKYGVTYLEYYYSAQGKLETVTYRSNKSIKFNYNSTSGLLENVQYTYNGQVVCTTGFGYLSNSNTKITHYTGVDYHLSYSSGQLFAYSTDHGEEYSNSHGQKLSCTVMSNGAIIKKEIGNKTVDQVQYDFLKVVDDKIRIMDVTNLHGVKTRMHFNGEDVVYSYEISDEMFSNDENSPNRVYLGKVNFHVKDQIAGTQGYTDGTKMTYFVDEYGTKFDMFKYSNNIGNAIMLSGWLKASSNIDQCNISFFNGETFIGKTTVNDLLNDNWVYFTVGIPAYAFNNMYVSVGRPRSEIEMADFRLIYNDSDSHNTAIETVLIDPAGQIFPIKGLTFYLATTEEIDNAIELDEEARKTGENDEIDKTDGENFKRIPTIDLTNKYISENDILKYQLSMAIGHHIYEGYLCDCREIFYRNKPITVKLGEYFHYLTSLSVGKQYTQGTKTCLTSSRVGTGDILLTQISCIDGAEISRQEYNTYLDIIHSLSDGLGTVYQYLTDSNGIGTGLVTRKLIGGIDTEAAYDLTDFKLVSTTDEHNVTTTYTTDPVWGVVTATSCSGESVEDSFDQGKNALTERKFNNLSTHAFSYSGGNLTSLSSGNLTYGFTYNCGSLVTVSKCSAQIEKHILSENDKVLTSSYPDSNNAIYSVVQRMDNYGRLAKIDYELQNTYDINPTYENGTYDVIGIDNGTGKLALSEDMVTGNKTRYGYGSKGVTSIGTFDTSEETKLSEETFDYDSLGRLTKNTYTFGTNTVGNEFTYLIDENAYNADQRIGSARYKVNGSTAITATNYYDIYKRISRKLISLGGAFDREITYSGSNRISKVLDVRNGSTFHSVQYTYDGMGRITKEKDSVDTTVNSNYVYDTLGQLIREDNKSLDKTLVYEYNGIGNITAVKEYSLTAAGVTPSVTPTTTSYTYDTTQVDKLTNFGGKAVTYDNLGNVKTYDGWTYTWTRGRLTKMSKGNRTSGTYAYNFTYNGYGQRISKTYSFTPPLIGTVETGTVLSYTQEFSYDNSGRLVYQKKTGTRQGQSGFTEEITFLYDESSIIGMLYFNGASTVTYYFDRNIRGDVIRIYNPGGGVVAKYTYDAYGNCNIASGTTSFAVADANPIRYRGYYYDSDTKLYYLNARYYNPAWRRFISPDDTAYLDPESVNGLNLYAYCNNDPVNYVDPNGCAPEWWQWVLAGLAVAGAITVSVLTAGTAAPVLAGMLIGGAVSAGFEIGSQIIFDGGVHNIDAIISAALGGMVAGAISGIPVFGGFAFGDYVGTALLGGGASVVGGLVSGGVNDLESGFIAFSLGALGNAAAKAVNQLAVNLIAGKMMNIPSAKGRSLAINDYMIKHNVKPLGFEHSNLGGWSRNIFKNMSKKCLIPIVADTTNRYAIVYSAFISSSISGWY